MSPNDVGHEVLNALSAHVCVLDERGTVLSVNRAWRDFAAAGAGPARPPVGASYLEPSGAARQIRAVLGGELPGWTWDYSCHSPGKPRWFEASATRIDAPGPPRIVVTHTEITARKTAEEALLAGRPRWQSALDAAGDDAWDCDAATGMVRYGPRMSAMLGFAPDHTAHTHEELLARLHPADRDRVRAVVHAHLKGESPAYSAEYRMLCADGAYRWILARGRAVETAPDGRVLRSVGTHHDIGLRKTFEFEAARLNRLYSALSQVNRAVVGVGSREELFRKVTRVLVEGGGFRMAWVGWLDPATAAVVPVAQSGDDTGFLGKIRVFADTRPEAFGPVGTAVREGRPAIFNDFANDPRVAPFLAAAGESFSQSGFRAVAAFPVREGGAVRGALTVYATEPGFFGDREVELIEETARAVSFGLDHLDREEQRRLAQEALHASEERLRLALEAARLGTWEYDVGSGKAILDGYSERMYGFAPGEFPGAFDALLARVHPDDVGGLVEASRRACDSRTRFAHEHRVERPGGSVIWVRAEGEFSYGPDGRPARMRGAVMDITDRKRMEAELRDRQDFLHSIFNQTVDPITLIDVETGRFTEFNAAAHEILGYTREEFARMAVGDTEAELSTEQLMTRFRAFPLGQVQAFGATGRTKSGEILDIRVRLRRITLGGRDFILSIWRDTTGQNRAEAALRESESRYRVLFDEAAEGIVVADAATGEILDCNRAFLQLSGYSDRSDLVGRPQRVLHPPEAGTPEFSETFAQHRGKVGETLVARLLTRSGQVKTVEIKAVALEIAGRRVLLGCFRDITAELRHHNEREATLKLLRLLNDENQTRELIRGVTALLQEWTGCHAVGVRLRQGDEYPYSETRGFPAEFVEAENHLCARGPHGELLRDSAGNPVLECMCGNVICSRFDPAKPFFTAKGSFRTNSTSRLLASTTESDRRARTRNRCHGEGYESVALVPLRHAGRTLGLLQVNDPAPGRFTPDLIDFLENAADQIAIALAQRQAQAELKASEERFRDVVESVSEYLWETDAEGRLVYLSNRAELLEYPPAQLLGTLSTEYMDEANAARVRAFAAEVARDKRSFRDLEYPFRTPSGRTLWLSSSGVPILGLSGELKGFRGVALDITERKAAAEERARLADQLQQAQKMESIGRLAGGVAHDFNNLLTVINGYSGIMLKSLAEGDPLRDSAYEIHQAGDRAAALTKQLLAISRRQVVEPRPVSLNRFLTENRNMFGRLIGEDVDLLMHLNPGVGDILADPGQLHQVLMNLVVNARDAMPEGGRLDISTAAVQLDGETATLYPEAHPGPYVVLTVSDTGVGMTEEVRRHVFEPFFTTKSEGHGTGLGLSTVYGIVRQNGGWIGLDSEPGKGTSFRIGLPLAPAFIDPAAAPHPVPVLADPAAVPHPVPALADPAAGLHPTSAFIEPIAVPHPAPVFVAPAAASPRPHSHCGSETVLVVEDQDEVRKLTAALLKDRGYRVLEAEGGGEALVIAERHSGPIHLLLTDVVMPHMTGREVAERFLNLRPAARVLYMSGYTGDVLVRRSILESAAACLVKPFTAETLAGKVREVLSEPRAPRRILVADDDESIRKLFGNTLAAAGYEVELASDGDEVLKTLARHPFDLVITDLVMPNREGLETIVAVRKSGARSKIMAVSGAFDGAFLETARLLGAAAAVAKPVSPEQLIALVRKLLE
ncbi:MAG TPA: PAS domain S-box protein [Bryobacteraceae bacterium]|nr:PAS domain S-box protein [Bryobacteraceae bacterium]